MLDIIAALYLGALCATVVAVLIGLSSFSAWVKLALFATAAAWLGTVVTVGALGWLAPGALLPVPATLLPFTVLLAVLFGGWSLIPEFRSAILSLPLPVLVGLHAGRIGGIFFLLFYAEGRLSAPFAPVAGGGDIATGVAALALAAALALGFSVRRTWLRLWNAFGALDLVVAVSLGALSMPRSPFRVFTEEPGTLLMTTLPGLLVPAMLVPIFLLLHFATAAKLRTAEVHRLAVA